MKALILLCVIMVLGFSVSIQNERHQLSMIQSSNNLKFGNLTGAGCSANEFNTFINYINLASDSYKNDYEASLRQISKNLALTYSVFAFGRYSTIIQSYDSNYGFIVQSPNYEWAATSSKVDRNFPERSYMFFRNPDSNSYNLIYFSYLGKGLGIDSNKQRVINNIILTVEPSDVCRCYNKDISDKLQQYDGQKWNVICSGAYNLFFLIYTKNFQYIYTKPKNCYYGIWAV